MDEFGNVIVKERVYTEMELAKMQAVYPQVISENAIRNGASVLFLLGKFSTKSFLYHV